MNLQQLQVNLCALIKSRPTFDLENTYLKEIESSQNLLLVRKIAFWWRRIEIESYCRLTSSILISFGKLDDEVQSFFYEIPYSNFRDEVGLQFLKFIAMKYQESIVGVIAGFELALIEVQLGHKIIWKKNWEYEPYSTIDALMRKDLQIDNLIKGNYEVEVSWVLKKDLFRVIRLDTNLSAQ